MHASLVHCLLSPNITSQHLDQVLPLARSLAVGGVCVPPFWIKKASRELSGSPVPVLSVVGYPFGYQMTETKIQEIALAMQLGAHELLVALNRSAFQSGMHWIKIELAKCAHIVHASERLLHLLVPKDLGQQEIIQVASTARDAGVDGIVVETAPEHQLDWRSLRGQIPDTLELSIMGNNLDTQQLKEFFALEINRIMGDNVLEMLKTKPTS